MSAGAASQISQCTLQIQINFNLNLLLKDLSYSKHSQTCTWYTTKSALSKWWNFRFYYSLRKTQWQRLKGSIEAIANPGSQSEVFTIWPVEYWWEVRSSIRALMYPATKTRPDFSRSASFLSCSSERTGLDSRQISPKISEMKLGISDCFMIITEQSDGIV